MGVGPGQSVICSHSAHSRSRDLPRGIGGPPGEVGVGCGSLWGQGHWQLRPQQNIIITLIFLFHFVLLLFFIIFLFFYFFFYFLIFNILSTFILLFHCFVFFPCFCFSSSFCFYLSKYIFNSSIFTLLFHCSGFFPGFSFFFTCFVCIFFLFLVGFLCSFYVFFPIFIFFTFFNTKFWNLVCILFYFQIYFWLHWVFVCCCARAFSSCGKWWLPFVVVHRLLIAVASLVAEHRL